jgi:T-complex protein 1 subunit beta
MIGEDKVIRFSGCSKGFLYFLTFLTIVKGESCTVVLRGASNHVLDEAERSLHDALCVLISTVKSKRVTYGGGYSEMVMAKACDDAAKSIKGK